ncbi:SDR family oxidoreductase [Crocosphaera sp. XPORK-15E]|uniref:SDR family NAD(P)-dependent oxidoreductase n=1 Tax=Crocosphaera sp. XPORK-15E TaxID=3110247 RepID=UPI002B216855|nr:SDR family oxidoreductase [Crocosphaera sp. XPORK-15E]MEA5532466.1 SDR family oxidoreductase [Crocosphaera sp. XPORK-15E]
MEKKAIVITGGSKGIGRAILEKFVSEGFIPLICSRNPEHLETLKTQYPQIKLHCFLADLSQKSEVKRFAQFIRDTGLTIDVLVNNVGLFIPGQICDEPEGNLELMMQTNLYSAYYLTRELIDPFIKQKQGHIFNMCSVASIIPYPKGSSYTITKFALLGFSKVLREELKPHNIKVTAILPSATITDSWQGTDLPLERFIQPEDVADLVYACYGLSPYCVPEEILLRPQAGDII